MRRWRVPGIFLLLLIAMLFPVKASAAGKVKGIDVSVYNGTIDWEKVKDQGYTYVMIKTGDGQEPENFEDDIDPLFEDHYQGAKAAGLKVGVYHVCCCRSVSDAKKEAEYCLKILNGRELDYPVAYDMEMDGNFAKGKANTTKMAKAFCDRIRSAGYTPMIYSSAEKLNKYFSWKKLSGILVWVAHYDVRKPDFSGIYHMWQHSNTGSVAGASSNVDLNHSYLEKPEKLKVKKKKITLRKGKSYQIKASVSPETVYDALKFRSSKKKVASVSSKGLIKARKKGTTVITVRTVNGIKVKITVKVK